MPTVEKLIPAGKQQKLIKLKDVKPGEIFRFPVVSFEEALNDKSDDGQGFYMVIASKPEKAGRVTAVSSDGKSIIERDDDREVVVHPAKLVIEEAALV